MPVFVQVDVPNEEVAAGAAEVIRARLSDAEDLYKNIGQHMLLSTDDRFREEEAPDGEPWQPLSPATLASKKRNKDKILQEQGRPAGLRGSITYETYPDGVRIGTPKVYGRVHQLGSEGYAGTNAPHRAAISGGLPSTFSVERRAGIPPRPFLGVSEADLEAIRGMVTRFINEGK